MQVYKLKNGLTVIIEPRKRKTTAIQITVNTGSNNETKGIHGISHFIEHMVFTATKNKASATEISNEIEAVGGELNAATSNERTFYYVKSLYKHFDKALNVLSDIILNPLFKKENIGKERRVILDEVRLVTDEPRFHQWIFFQKNIFKKIKAKNPIYGVRSEIRRMSRKDILRYYKKYYVPGNTVIVVVGNTKGVLAKIKKAFKDFKGKSPARQKEVKEPANKRIVAKEKRRTFQSYMVLGYKTVKRKHQDSYVFDVIRAILAKGQSGKLFEEIRTKRSLAYEIGVNHEAGVKYGFFAVYLGTQKKNINKVRDIILGEFKKLKNITAKELKQAKDHIEGTYTLQIEDNQRMADTISFWHFVGDIKLTYDYVKNIRKVTKKDVARVVDKYLNDRYCLSVIEQK